MSGGDFKYNGTPIFEVGFSDFSTITEYLNHGGRLLSRNIERDDMREYYVKRGLKFGIRYEGILIDLSSVSHN